MYTPGATPPETRKNPIMTLKGSHHAEAVRPFHGRKNLTRRSGGVAPGYYIGRFQRPPHQLKRGVRSRSFRYGAEICWQQARHFAHLSAGVLRVSSVAI